MHGNGSSRIREMESSIYRHLMEYVAYNVKSGMLLSTTSYHGFKCLHQYTHEKWDELKREFTDHLGSMYQIVPEFISIEAYGYSMPTDLRTHLLSWDSRLQELKTHTGEAHKIAVENNDLVLASILDVMNMHVINEMKHIKHALKLLVLG